MELVGWRLHSFLWLILLSLWSGILLIFALKNLYCRKDEKTVIYIAIRRAAIVYLLCYFVAPIFLLYEQVNNDEYDATFIIMATFSGTLSTIGMISHCFWMVLRLKLTFNDSIYAISKRLVYIYYSIMGITVILCIIAYIVGSLEYYALFTIIFGFVFIMIVLIGVHVTYLFNKKLFDLTLTQRQSTNNNNKDEILNERQIKLLQVITKQTLLQTCSFMGYILLIIVSIICIIIDSIIDDKNYDTSLSICGWLFMLTINHGTYCVYLSFSVNEKLYKKSCKNLNYLLKKYCTKLTEKRIIEMNKKPKHLKAISSMSQPSNIANTTEDE